MMHPTAIPAIAPVDSEPVVPWLELAGAVEGDLLAPVVVEDVLTAASAREVASNFSVVADGCLMDKDVYKSRSCSLLTFASTSFSVDQQI